MEPAHSIIKILGGERAVSEAIGSARNAPYRWQYPREKGGTGGVIPHWHIPAMLAYARKIGVDLTANDFVLVPNIATPCSCSTETP